MANRKWTAIPAARSDAMALRTKQFILFGIIGFMALLGPIAFVISITSNGASTVVATSGPGEEVATAKRALLDYFSGEPTSVPLAGSVQQIFENEFNAEGVARFPIKSLDYIESVDNSDNNNFYKIHYFILVSGSNTYKVSISTSSVSGHSVIVAGPSIEPYDFVDSNQTAIDYSYYTQLSPSSDVQKAVEDWANAYFGNDTEALKAAVDDNNEYLGLEGLTVVGKTEITSFFPNSVVDNTYYARVIIQYSALGAKQLKLTAEYDTLLLDDGKQLPHVVAWGSAGNTPLTPYQNRVK